MTVSNGISVSSLPTAVALGSFDGIHVGHQAVIRSTIACKEKSLVPTVFTFKENPYSVISGKVSPCITTASQRHYLLENMGVQQLYEVDFEEIRNLSPEDFVDKILDKTLNAKEVFCGFNYRFGVNRSGDFETLRKICKEHGITAHCVEPVCYKGLPVSSTRIRKALLDGKIQEVNAMLGRCFSFILPICEGNKLGRTLGFPTLNQLLPETLIKPRFGVYASVYINQGDCFCSVTNIGTKPTVGKNSPLAETWVIDANLHSLYGQTAHIALLDFIRDEVKFNSIAELKEAVFKDKDKASSIYIRELSQEKIIF